MDIEASIRDAYRRIVHQPGDFVSLTAIRSLLVGIRYEDMDRALIGMYCRQEINLVPQSNQRELTAMDRALGVRCGGEVKHLISIE